MSRRSLMTVLALALICGSPLLGRLRAGGPPSEQAATPSVPDLSSLGRSTDSKLADLVDRYAADRQAMLRRYDVEISPDHRRALRSFYAEWRTKLATLPFDSLGVEERIDAILLNVRLGWEVQLLDRREEGITQAQPLVPFSVAITALHDARRRLEPVDPVKAAETLTRLAVDVDRTRAAVEAGLASGAPAPGGPAPIRTSPVAALRAAEQLAELRTALTAWHRHFTGYDPEFTWWTAAPFKRADETLKGYEELLRKKVVGVGTDGEERIVGAPIGREALVADLGFELIPYTPEVLLTIAEREFAWCEAELRQASREMGFGDDWKAALEKVKTLHVAPGKQPDLIRDLAREAEEYVERHGLITVPPLAKQVWRVEMMSPERQRVSPFFLGGEVIRVSFPTDTMSHEDKLMSLRGNNAHFARATVFHELIPGHHLQGFMTARHNAHRRAFSTPFWGEGWALYWEMLLWDRSFQRSPEDRVGMLFWRSHRAARIIFSLRFHMGTMTPQECIDFLVDRVGHERANATAEVRRSFNGSYPPLYQLAYMIGGLQFRALHRELVGSGRMSDRQFHDAIITGGSMPVEMVRARLTTQPLARDHRPSWRFAGAPEPAPAGR